MILLDVIALNILGIAYHPTRTAVSNSNADVKSKIEPKMFPQFMWEIAVIIVFSIPFTHVLRVFAKALKSNVLKNSLIPVAIDNPKSAKSNVSPNDRAA